MRLYLALLLTLTSLNRARGQSAEQIQGDKQNDQSLAVYEQLSGLGPGQAGFFLSDVGYTAAQFQSNLPVIPSSVATFTAAAPSNARSPPRQQSNTQSQHRFQLGSHQSSSQERDSPNIADQHNQQAQPNQRNQQAQPNQYNQPPQPNQRNQQAQPNQYNQQAQPNQPNQQAQPNQRNQQAQPNQYNQQPQPNQYNRQQYQQNTQQYNQYYQSINKQQMRQPTQAVSRAQSAGSSTQAQANQYNQYNQQRQQADQFQYNTDKQRRPLSPPQQRQPLTSSQQSQSLPPPQQYQPLSPSQQRQSLSPPQQYQPLSPSQQRQSLSPPQQYQPLSPSQQRQSLSPPQQYQPLSPSQQRQSLSPPQQYQPLSPSKQSQSLPPPQQHQPLSPSQQSQSLSLPQQYQPLSPSQQRQSLSPPQQYQPLSPSQQSQSLPPPQQHQPLSPSQQSQSLSLPQQYQPLSPSQQSQSLSPPQQYQPLSPSQQSQSLSPPQQYQRLSPSQQNQPTSIPQQYQTVSNTNTVNQENYLNNQPSISYSSDRNRHPPQQIDNDKIRKVTQFPPQITLTRPLHVQESVIIEEDNRNDSALSKNYHEEKPTQIFNVEDDKSQVIIPGGNSLIHSQSHTASQSGHTNLRFQGTFTLNRPHQINLEQRGHENSKINNFEDKVEEDQLNKQNQAEKLKDFSNFGTRQRKTNKNHKSEGPIDVKQHRNRSHQRQQIASTVSPSVDEEHMKDIIFLRDQHIPEDHIQRIRQGNNRNPDNDNDFREDQILEKIIHPTPLFSNLKEIRREQPREQINVSNSFISQDNNQSFEGNKNEIKQVQKTDNALNRSLERAPVNNPTERRRVKVVRQKQRVHHQSKDENNDEVRHQVLNYPKQSLSKIISKDKEEIKSPEEVAHLQAVNAKYSFQSSFNDTIHDNSQMRQEVRDGLKIKGQYSYSDGFFKRTVHYVADENGYRVIKEINEPIGDGPIHDPDGQVDLNSSRDGRGYKYSVSARDIPSIWRSQEEPLDIDVRFSN